MKNWMAVLAATVLLVACGGDSVAPAATPWYVGTWRAVRANSAPLPFQYESFGTTYRVDSMTVQVYSYAIDEGLFATKGSRSSAQIAPLPDNYARFADVVAGGDSVSIRDDATGSQGRLYLTFFRQPGDTLVLPSYLNAQWKLVKFSSN